MPSKFYRCLVFVIFFLASISAGATSLKAAESNFFQQIPEAKQAMAREIWDFVSAKHMKPFDLKKGTDKPAIPDSTLFDDISDENKADDLTQLASLRITLLKQQQAHWILASDAAAWKEYVATLKNDPALGGVYLQAIPKARAAQKIATNKAAEIKEIQDNITEIRVNASLSEVSLSFTRTDWIVIIVYLIFTTILGGMLAGKQSSIKDFFLGGRKLPWPAVCGSIIATELSAATFLIAPAIVFSQGGDMTYIQLALGTIIARFIIGYFFIPAYYKHEIYSPYDYMGNQLGHRVKKITTILFMIGGILAQGARVYIAAKALQVITGTDIVLSIMVIGFISVLWTIIGGITTVIWTDTIQFILFAVGAVLALFFVGNAIDGGFYTVISEGVAAGKYNMLNLNFNPKEAYTLWCGLFASGFLTLGSHGTDQLMAQRMFTCKNQQDARKAIIWSSTSVVVTFLLLMVGAGIFVYYKHLPLGNAAQVIVNDDSMKIFAIYIVQVMPPALSGLLMAALFATAISTLDSILAALSQSTISILYKPYIKPDATDKHYVRASRVIVFIWGILLTGFAIYCDTLSKAFTDLLQFALAMAAYTYGALLGTFLLAFLPTRRDDLGLMWGVPLSMLTVFALNWHQPIPQMIVAVISLILVTQAFRLLQKEPQKIIYIAIATGLTALISFGVIGYSPEGDPIYISLAWPWHYPIGAAVTFVVGYLVGNKKDILES